MLVHCIQIADKDDVVMQTQFIAIFGIRAPAHDTIEMKYAGL
jgi:hypothetical protein